MNFDNISIGTDIEQISRFNNKTLDNSYDFLKRIFTEKELNYSFKHKDYARHLCARYCAKEAIVKALSAFDIKDVHYIDIEILNKGSGEPYATVKKYPNIKLKLSLSHAKEYAVAFTIAQN